MTHTRLHDPERLSAVAESGLVDAPPDAELDHIAHLAARSLDVPVALISVLDGALQHFCAQVGLPDELAEAGHTPLSRALCRHVVDDGSAVVICDARQDERTCRDAAVVELGVGAYLGVPLRVNGHLLGALCAMDQRPRTWGADDRRALERLALVVSDVLALRLGSADPLMEAAVERSVLASLPDTAVMQLDADLRVRMAEGGGFRAAGWPPEHLVGRRLVDVLPAKAYAELGGRCRRALSGEVVSFDFDASVGRTWSVQASPSPARDGASPGVSVVMRDVTEDRARERALAERETQYRLLAENSTDVISRHAPDGRYLYVSPAARTLFGIPCEEMVGRDPYDFIHPDDRETVRSRQSRLVERAGPATSSYRVRRPDGVVLWVESTASAVRDAAGVVRELQCATRDITARRAAEQARDVSQAMAQTVVAALEDGLLVFGPDGRLMGCNASAERILGVGAQRITGKTAPPADLVIFDENGRRVPPAELPAARVLATGEPQLNDVYAIEHADGSRAWVRANAVPLHDRGTIERVLVSLADITELRHAEQRARHRADHDELTGLPNRASLHRSLRRALAAGGPGGDLAVFFLDLDRFKVVNDSLGHQEGDRLLLGVAERLRGALRSPSDVLARFGGDEFVVVAADVGGRDGAARMAERLLRALDEPIAVGDVRHAVEGSVGVAVADGGQDAEELLRDADVAMYDAKGSGGGAVRLFEPALRERAVARLSLEQELRRAIARNELELHFQPVFTVADRALIGAEALVRWRHPTRGLIPPATFIPVAEQSGLILELGDWVLEETCRRIAAWRAQGHADVPPIAVNISARQLRDPAIVARVAGLLERYDLDPLLLTLELTETLVMERGTSEATLFALHDLGIRIALDDFGTGHSSLSRLHSLPIDTVKIDRAFVTQLDDPQRGEAIAAAIIAMAHSLRLRVVAEGVETEPQLETLRRLGCTYAQGYLLGRPMPAERFAAQLG